MIPGLKSGVHRMQRGFTLIELVLALTIVSIVVALILGAFQVGQQAWSRGDAAAEAHQRLRVVMERMRRQLIGAVAQRMPNQDSAATVFEGDTRHIDFISLASLAPGVDRGLVTVRYMVRDEAAGEALFFAEKPLVALTLGNEGQAIDDQDAQRLLDSMTAVSFAYMAPYGAGRGSTWQAHWPEDQLAGLPAAIKVSLRQAPGDPLIEMVVRVASYGAGEGR